MRSDEILTGMKLNLTISISIALIVTAASSCNSGEQCMKELTTLRKELRQSFAQGDSSRTTDLALEIHELADCVTADQSVPDAWRSDALSIGKEGEEALKHIHCRCYKNRLGVEFGVIADSEEVELVIWEGMYERWNEVVSTTTLSAGAMTTRCDVEDLSDIANMKAEIEMKNGYYVTKNAIDTFEESIDDLISTSKGIWDALEEAFEE